MSTKTIPAAIVTTCDRCGKTKPKDGSGFRRSVTLKMDSASLDYQGFGVGPGERINADFCDTCADTAFTVVRQLFITPASPADGGKEE